MIKIRIEIQNPWSRDIFKNLGCIFGRLTRHKSWELEHTVYDGTLFDFNFEWTRRGDHAGLEIVLGVLTYGIRFRIYDHRHWDYENNRWAVYN